MPGTGLERVAPVVWPLALRKDARHPQILALASLLALNFAWVDFGAKLLPSLLAFASALATQAVCTWVWRGRLDLRSPLITALSLSLLLRADAPWLHALAGAVAIASKFLLRLDGKHIWNPAGFAIVVLLLVGAGHVWISPGQWGTGPWLVALVVGLALLVLGPLRRADVALAFLGGHAALLAWRALWLGDPLAIPLHQMQSGSLLIFAFFMISDPRTTPDGALGRIAFGLGVAALAHWLAFSLQMRPALYVALVILSPLVPVLDRAWPSRRFAWADAPATGASL